MKRSEFLKRLGLGIVAIPLAPQFIATTKDAFDGEKVNSLLSDEAGKWQDPKDSEYHLKWCKELYAHHEEPLVHPAGWPLRVNDLVLVPDNSGEIEGEAQYLVTKVMFGVATCTPLIDGPNIELTKENSNNVIVFSNINSQL